MNIILPYNSFTRFASYVYDDQEKDAPSQKNLYQSIADSFFFDDSNYFSPYLNDDKVNDIVLSILRGERQLGSTYRRGGYSFSPFILREVTKRPDYSFQYFLRFQEYPNRYFGLFPLSEDYLVLLSLGIMLNDHFHRMKLFTSNSFDLLYNNSCYKEYHQAVCTTENKVVQVFRVDLSNSLKSLRRNDLLLHLSVVIKSHYIIQLIEQFLNTPTQDKYGRDFTNQIPFCIPPFRVIADVLLNYELIECDHSFPCSFPGVKYNRLNHEILISCSSEDMSFFSE